MQEILATASRLIKIVDHAEAHLSALTPEQAKLPVLPGGWSRAQLLGHLIDSASNNHQRFVRASQQDSLDFPAYDQTRNIEIQAPEVAPWPTLVTLWASYNHYLAHVIAHLPAGKLEATCRIGTNPPVTLRYLVVDYLRHLEHHLGQIGLQAE